MRVDRTCTMHGSPALHSRITQASVRPSDRSTGRDSASRTSCSVAMAPTVIVVRGTAVVVLRGTAVVGTGVTDDTRVGMGRGRGRVVVGSIVRPGPFYQS